jgi:hypothetical protein
MSSPAPSTFKPPPMSVAVMELPSGLTDDEYVIEVEPPMTPFI